MERETIFIDVILPLAVPNLYTYRIPFELNEFVCVGQRVVIPFGRSKLYTAIVKKIHNTPPKYTTKYIEFILDEQPIVTAIQLKLWDWISEHYMCHIGEVMLAALPSSLKLASETKVLINDRFEGDLSSLSDQEYLIKDALELRSVLSLGEIGEILDIKTVYPIVKRLIDKGVVVAEEELKESYRPKKEKYVELAAEYQNEDKIEALFDELKRAVKQQELFMLYLQMSNYFANKVAVKKTELLNKVSSSPAVLKGLYEKGILTEYALEIGRFKEYEGARNDTKELSDIQKSALSSVEKSFEEKDICLLHGVTGSGKTEVYVELINKHIANGEQVLYLLPEIALTTQMINRLRKYFGNKIGIYHSKFSPNERVEVWNAVLKNKLHKYDVLLGARSAVFLPFDNLGLIIVDEEHETSFKQYDPAPRYNARDTAYVLAKMHGAKVLLGSATPSIETMYSANEGKIGLVEMKKRFGNMQLPEILCADIGEHKKKKKMHGIFSEFLIKEMKEALERKEQIILFQNRRGYAPRWTCEVCGWVPMCTRCDVSLTYHKYTHKLNCHYCGYTISPPNKCDACGSSEIKMLGFGTEKIEEEISIHLSSDVKIQRMDLDTTRSKFAYQNIINDFENREIDILVGTQMVTKGLDFDNVSLVGVLNADDMLYYPDFRAFERAYQLMTQVSGRAGRKKHRGKVIIQTHTPEHWIIQKVMQNDYDGMYDQELYERKNYQYPPFYRLIRLTVRHKEKETTDAASAELAKMLQVKLGNRILGPEYPSVPRIKNVYNKMVTIKFERSASVAKVKAYLLDTLANLKQIDGYKSVRVKIDVDPL